ncbi:hypothetical protein HU200_006527 [Digitaria exilis]|uniref:Protein XRI1 n=1 Tax=Digitaria exilis TaxID=1010633 RepID=A0A835KVH4_9POAL|nr:hypothetical protein HU200_006527 [Digitaria exilis]
METVQERELHGWQAWLPLDTMACSLDDTTTSGFLLRWDPQLSYFGLAPWGAHAGDLDTHHGRQLELVVPKCMESPMSEASTATVTGVPTPQDATAMPGELDELLQESVSADDDHFAVNPILPTSPEKTLTQPQAEPPSSSSSHCGVDPSASDTSVAPDQMTHAKFANRSSKRSAPEGTVVYLRQRCRDGGVARPFTVVKPGGADGNVTLADINRWILTPPARPVRHPVGEFACAPRVAAGNRPAPSGKTVAGFTRLRTGGRGTITIVRTRG